MLRALALTAAIAAFAAAPVQARPQTTHTQTIGDANADNRLEPGPGEDYLLRDNLGTKTPAARPLTRLFYSQLTDFHVIDEESPLRVEFLDAVGPPFTGAYRPQEGLMPQVVEEMIDQVRNTVSPFSHRKVELAMTTGDNTDNTQCNETRWMIDLMDGRNEVDPNSGIEGDIPEPELADVCNTVVDGQDPNPSFPPAAPPLPDPSCATLEDNGSIYDGVKGDEQYYDPDGEDDGPGYSPREEQNVAEAGRTSEVRDFPGLFERMNEPFRTTGIDLPWYGIFGNHDGLIQGNQPRQPQYEALAVGCLKPKGTTLTNPEPGTVLPNVLDVVAGGPSSLAGVIPPDPRRRPLRKSEYIAEHFATTGTPVGHGFTPENVASGMGYYSFHPKPGLKFVVLDSIAENGGDGGSVDHPQFRWLHDELLSAEQAGELVMVFAHHSLRTMNQAQFAPPFTPGDNGGDGFSPVHNGFRSNGENEPCDAGPASNEREPTPDETVHCLLLRHHSVIAFVNGHEHANRIDAFARNGTDEDRAQGGYWEVNTASHIDWPQQSRMIDVVDNRDGSLSIVTTIVDHSAAPNPGSGGGSSSVQRLASIARELSFNEPDSMNGQDGRGDARGAPEDRNTELVVKNPYGG